jgi:hypothetical protein
MRRFYHAKTPWQGIFTSCKLADLGSGFVSRFFSVPAKLKGKRQNDLAARIYVASTLFFFGRLCSFVAAFLAVYRRSLSLFALTPTTLGGDVGP